MTPTLSFEDVVRRLKVTPHPARQNYLAMYSTWLGGIVKEPELMMVPIDDHVVHRGDGVFEAIKIVGGKIYALDRHLERLAVSAATIGLRVPNTLAELKQICIETTRAAGCPESAMLRLYCSRGPGGFSTNPNECLAPQVYLVVTRYKALTDEKYHSGVKVGLSRFGVKEGFFATAKTCNYLVNVLMKKESMELGLDFTISRDERGGLAESSTENFAVITAEGEFRVPPFERILRGVTAVRAMELAQALVASGVLQSVRNASISVEEVERAREVMMLGTTLDCLAVTTFAGKPVADGRVGPVCQKLRKLLQTDMAEGPLLTRVDEA